MIAWQQVLILAVVQGLTEFLPVSSSGHLVLFQNWFGSQEGDIFLDVVLHCGTLGSVLWIYRREIVRLLRCDAAALRYIWAVVVGTLPAVLVGALLRPTVASLFERPILTGFALIITAAVLLTTRFRDHEPGTQSAEWQPVAPGPGKAFLIGIAQSLAITPGISRSGMTITASLWLGVPRAEAARFSFLLSVPAIGGALLLELLKGEFSARTGPWGLGLGAVVAFVVGLAAIRWTARAVQARHFWWFSFYCLGLGLLVLVLLGGGSG